MARLHVHGHTNLCSVFSFSSLSQTLKISYEYIHLCQIEVCIAMMLVNFMVLHIYIVLPC